MSEQAVQSDPAVISASAAPLTTAPVETVS
jgi:hypothetical protein